MKAVSVMVSGRVQGVGYRAWTAAEAERAGVAGWVRNMPDGQVAAHFEGDPCAVDSLCQLLWSGPRHAVVDKVICCPASALSITYFEVLR